jgi:hypothetical protein
LDSLASEGCFLADVCRPPEKKMTPEQKLGESLVFRDFFTARLRLIVSKRFAEILAAYKVQIH